MQIWSRVSQLLWREARPPAAEPALPVCARATGAPRYVRQAVRFTMTGFAATLLTSQIVGIRLMAPVDASNGYGTCTEMCDAQYNMDVAACAKLLKLKYCPPGTYQNCLDAAATKRDNCKAGCGN